MKHPILDRLPNKKLFIPVVAAAFALVSIGLLTFPTSSSGQHAGWSGSAGMKSGCVGWNCDGKNPCTGMGCSDSPSTKVPKPAKTGSTSTDSGKTKPSKNSKSSNDSTHGPSQFPKQPSQFPHQQPSQFPPSQFPYQGPSQFPKQGSLPDGQVPQEPSQFPKLEGQKSSSEQKTPYGANKPK